MGLNLLTVFEQDEPDPQFPTVKSPNPENSEALTLAIELAEREGADIVDGWRWTALVSLKVSRPAEFIFQADSFSEYYQSNS